LFDVTAPLSAVFPEDDPQEPPDTDGVDGVEGALGFDTLELEPLEPQLPPDFADPLLLNEDLPPPLKLEPPFASEKSIVEQKNTIAMPRIRNNFFILHISFT
jgi:hypothetical protein